MQPLNGKIFLYRVWDIGMDADLESLQKSLISANSQRFRLSKNSRAMIINNAPLILNLEGGMCTAVGQNLDFEMTAKIWHFGAVSVNIQLNIPPTANWEGLIELGSFLENDPKIHQLAIQKVTQLLTQFDRARLDQMNWETFEDYTLYFFKSLPGAEQNAMDAFKLYDISRLILSENGIEPLADQVIRNIQEGALQYNRNDLAVVNWNSALIVEPSGSPDIADTIEFALCQLLEMRYYDDLLDDKLAALYSALEKKQLSIWETYSEKLSKEAAQKYIEISDTIESVENSLKVVGDFYLAQIFRTASARFRFNDWRDNVDQKLDNLAGISKLLTNDINERRSRLMELVVIILISIEVLPFLTRWLDH